MERLNISTFHLIKCFFIELILKCTCVGISKGALLSIEAQVAVSPFKYASNSLRSGRRTADIFAAYNKRRSLALKQFTNIL